jgi:hypothetical protein
MCVLRDLAEGNALLLGRGFEDCDGAMRGGRDLRGAGMLLHSAALILARAGVGTLTALCGLRAPPQKHFDCSAQFEEGWLKNQPTYRTKSDHLLKGLAVGTTNSLRRRLWSAQR